MGEVLLADLCDIVPFLKENPLPSTIMFNVGLKNNYMHLLSLAVTPEFSNKFDWSNFRHPKDAFALSSTPGLNVQPSP